MARHTRPKFSKPYTAWGIVPKPDCRKPFENMYYFWGHGSIAKRPDKKGFTDDLAEAYGNASRHLGRGSVYFKAVIVDREQGKIIAVLTRSATGIAIKED